LFRSRFYRIPDLVVSPLLLLLLDAGIEIRDGKMI
jgi:hypothetical protein